MDDQQKCRDCLLVLPLDAFTTRKGNKLGRSGQCKQCRNEYMRNRRVRSPRSPYFCDTAERTRECSKCRKILSFDAFGNQNGGQAGLASRCYHCVNSRRRWRREQDPLRVKRQELKHRKKSRAKRYGMTLEQYDTLLIDQCGRCAICDVQLKVPYVDHDHTSGAVRGLLCLSCNTGLGHFKDNAQRLARAIAYVDNAALKAQQAQITAMENACQDANEQQKHEFH